MESHIIKENKLEHALSHTLDNIALAVSAVLLIIGWDTHALIALVPAFLSTIYTGMRIYDWVKSKRNNEPPKNNPE